mmetsp:Transcript_38562/g.78656  ORF Transcript_38562/g.78656 Transcript_38562/m.78656 type:complete len:235 (+) Transcript_38562:399-1103(+)
MRCFRGTKMVPADVIFCDAPDLFVCQCEGPIFILSAVGKDSLSQRIGSGPTRVNSSTGNVETVHSAVGTVEHPGRSMAGHQPVTETGHDRLAQKVTVRLVQRDYDPKHKDYNVKKHKKHGVQVVLPPQPPWVEGESEDRNHLGAVFHFVDQVALEGQLEGNVVDALKKLKSREVEEECAGPVRLHQEAEVDGEGVQPVNQAKPLRQQELPAAGPRRLLHDALVVPDIEEEDGLH